MEAELTNFKAFLLGRTFGVISFGPFDSKSNSLEPKLWVELRVEEGLT